MIVIVRVKGAEAGITRVEEDGFMLMLDWRVEMTALVVVVRICREFGGAFAF